MLWSFRLVTPRITGFDWGMVNKLCISHDVGPAWALGYNLGYDLADGRGTFTYAMAIGKAINDRFGLYFEPYGELVLREVITPASMRA